MATRRGSCSCGQLTVEVEGDPVRVSICHCLACQRRTGSAFGMQARWPRQQVRIEGDATEYVRISDEGEQRSSFFCPRCGATVYFWSDTEHIAVPIGAFADPNVPRRASRCGRIACARGSACPTGSSTSAELLLPERQQYGSRPGSTKNALLATARRVTSMHGNRACRFRPIPLATEPPSIVRASPAAPTLSDVDRLTSDPVAAKCHRRGGPAGAIFGAAIEDRF
jgi:hypothetical protein